MKKTSRKPLAADEQAIERLQKAFDHAHETCDYTLALRELRAIARALGKPGLTNLLRSSDPPFASVYKVAKALGFKLGLHKAA